MILANTEPVFNIIKPFVPSYERNQVKSKLVTITGFGLPGQVKSFPTGTLKRPCQISAAMATMSFSAFINIYTKEL